MQTVYFHRNIFCDKENRYYSIVDLDFLKSLNKNKKLYDTKGDKYIIVQYKEGEIVGHKYPISIVVKRLSDNVLFMISGECQCFDPDANSFFDVFWNKYDQDTELLEFNECKHVQIIVDKYIVI